MINQLFILIKVKKIVVYFFVFVKMEFVGRDFADFAIINRKKYKNQENLLKEPILLGNWINKFFDRFRISKNSFKIFISNIKTKISKNSGIALFEASEAFA
jgi:hypothetical protein